jgi:glucose-6-phosphate isomerase
MDSNRINELLKKYWSCETSLEEEAELREHFKSSNAPDELKDAAALFRYFEENKKKSLNDISFEGRVMEKIHTPPKRGQIARLTYNAMRIAAGLGVVLAATWFIRNEIRSSNPPEVVDTYDDPKMAFEETKKALMMISKSFGTAEEQAKKINLFNKAQEEIQNKKEDNL